jgi:adenylate cyclase, class 2
MLEIEKKYRLTKDQREAVLERLSEIGAKHTGEEFEENVLYGSHLVDLGRSILRLRRTGNAAVLTHKERLPDSSPIKHQKENETRVEDPEAMADILAALSFTPNLVYEKVRDIWDVNDVEIVIDRLPFGLFMEIEGSEENIEAAESKLGIKELAAEHATYPELTAKHGKQSGDVIEARFDE